MKYLLLLLLVAILVWMISAKSRGRLRRDAQAKATPKPQPAPPQAMLSCAHCGLHMPAADALADGARVYCSDAHRRLGPGTARE